MGTYNTLRADLICLHCHVRAAMEIELFFGDTRTMDIYVIGDRYKWRPSKAVHHGGRPKDGNLDGEGYTVCPTCHQDFFVKVMVRNDRIESASPDSEKPGYISSSDAASALQTPEVVQPTWDPVAYAERMKESTFPVSAFFLIDSPEAFARCTQWLSLLEPFGMPRMADSQYFRDVHRIYQAGRAVTNFDFDFNLRWHDQEFPGLLRCHFIDKGKYEIELWLPGVLANELADRFQDGYTGFFCAFMPPPFYD